jgi:hypothetical protein
LGADECGGGRVLLYLCLREREDSGSSDIGENGEEDGVLVSGHK